MIDAAEEVLGEVQVYLSTYSNDYLFGLDWFDCLPVAYIYKTFEQLSRLKKIEFNSLSLTTAVLAQGVFSYMSGSKGKKTTYIDFLPFQDIKDKNKLTPTTCRIFLDLQEAGEINFKCLGALVDAGLMDEIEAYAKSGRRK